MENPFSSAAVVSGSWTRVGFDGECSSPPGRLGGPAGATPVFEDIKVAGPLGTSLPPDKLEALSRRVWPGILTAPLSTCCFLPVLRTRPCALSIQRLWDRTLSPVLLQTLWECSLS